MEAQQERFGGLAPAILVAVFGILAVLVLEFGSFRSTAIVAGVIPLGITGALLVDFTNQLREQGALLDQAIQEAGEIRFLPILLTSATAISGLSLLARLITPVMYKLLPPPVRARPERATMRPSAGSHAAA